MEIYGLVGKSGTGKSYIAHRLALDLKADFIIDDGLLISHGHILAGFSAKFELNKIAAVRRAVFTERGHRDVVRSAMKRLEPKTGLVIGTSLRMISTICEQLELPSPTEVLPIERVSTPEEIRSAGTERARGMHAMPIIQSQLTDAPSVPGFVRTFWRRMKTDETIKHRVAPTVVSPLFSDGAIFVHPFAIRDSIRAFIQENACAFEFQKVVCAGRDAPTIHIHVLARYGYAIHRESRVLLQSILHHLQDALALPYPEICLHVNGLRMNTVSIH